MSAPTRPSLLFACEGAFHAVAWPPSPVLEDAFRRLLLAARVILAHRTKAGLESPFDARGPPETGEARRARAE